MSGVAVPEEVRRQLRQALASSTHMPADKIDEVADLACHAAEAGFAAMQRIALETSPDKRIGITALGPALGLLAGLVEAGTLALRKVGLQNGMASVNFQIGGGQ